MCLILSDGYAIIISNTKGYAEPTMQRSQTKGLSELKRIITYGTFDLLHYGHINLLKRAKELGDYLVVCLSTDEFNDQEKHKHCYFSYDERKLLLEAIRYVDLVIPMLFTKMTSLAFRLLAASMMFSSEYL